MRKRSSLAALLLIILASASPALAQRTTATVRGTVADTTGGVLPGVTVTAVNQDTGLSRTVVTNNSGVYSLPDLPVGRYNVSAELQGFKKAERTAVPLRVADEYSMDFTLQTGNLSETVTVEASSTPVKVMGGDVSGIVTGQQVRELPLNGRNFLQLATLMPGVSAPDALNVKDKGLLGGSDLSVSGGDTTANMWTVDGANNNDVGSNRTILVYPSLEAIEEFKILRNSYGPEFGGAGGAQINIVTRGGTNEFRGSAFYSGRSDKLNAKDYFLKGANQPKDALKRNDFGGTFGGPILKDKVHFFGSIEYNLEDRGTPRARFVPTDAEKTGDFNNPVFDAAGNRCSPPTPNDPLTGLPFPGNRIPANRLNAAGLGFLKLYPSPNVIPAAGTCNNWVTSITTPIKYHQYSGRFDWNVTARTRMVVRYTQDSWKNNSPSLFSNLWGDDPFPAVDSNWDQPSRSFVASLNQTIGNSATNTLQFSYSGNKIIIDRGEQVPGLNAEIVSLMPSIYPLSQKEYGDQVGHPVFWGNSGYDTLWNEAPFRNNMDLYVVKDDYTKVFGKHFLKAGVLLSWNKKNEDTNGNGSGENWSTYGASGLNGGWGGGTGNIMADFLLKDMTFGFTEFSTSYQNPQRWRDTEFYLADSWQATRRVTFDYGVRYSLFFNPYAADNRTASFQPDLYNAALGADPCNGLLIPPGTNWCQEAGARGGTAGPNRSLMKQDYNNFAPRLGVAWDIKGDGKTALRAGLGEFFLRERTSPGLNIAGNPPFVQTTSGLRYLNSNVEPCAGCFGRSLGAPNAGRELQQKTPHNWQWNMMFQHEVWRNATLETGYVGNYGYDQLRTYDVNQVPPENRSAYATTSDQGARALLRPYGAARGDNSITWWDHSGLTKYHSWQSQFVDRFGQGSQVQVSYTLSRSRANISMVSSGSLDGDSQVIDVSNRDLDWGRPAVGRTHIFSASLVWLLPRLENRGGLAKHLLGGWESTAIFGAASGQPLLVSVNVASGIPGGIQGTGSNNPTRPNRTNQPCGPPSGSRPEQIINPEAFTVNGFQLGTIGNEKRGECTGPAYKQTDLAFYKNFQLTNRVRAQFRWDIFNIFNTNNFIFGSVDTAYDLSGVTFNAAGNTIVNSVVSPGFGMANRTRDPRQMQLGFKLLW